MNYELEQRVKERTQTLKELIQDLEAFSYSVSHDLKTPLTLINGFAKMLKSNHFHDLSEEGQQHIKNIIKQSEKMDEMLCNLMKYSQLREKKVTLKEVDLGKLFTDTFLDLKHLYPNHKINFNLTPLPHVLGDESLLREVAVNLISNAIKFSLEKPVSEIEVSCEKGPQGTIIKVKDNGIGFDMKDQSKLFTTFSRLHQKEIQGCGVGLAIAQRIINRHDGKIWTESRPGKGSTFFIKLPLYQAKTKAA